MPQRRNEDMGDNPVYLGDGVHASFDGFQIWVKTDIGSIALEPGVFRELLKYQERIRRGDFIKAAPVS